MDKKLVPSKNWKKLKKLKQNLQMSLATLRTARRNFIKKLNTNIKKSYENLINQINSKSENILLEKKSLNSQLLHCNKS